MNPDCAAMAAALQEINCPENGHMAAKARREVRDDPMNI